MTSEDLNENIREREAVLAEYVEQCKALHHRKLRLDVEFEWSHEQKLKLLSLSAGMQAKYKEAYDEFCSLKKDCEERYKDYAIEFSIWYDAPEKETEEDKKLWHNLAARTRFKAVDFSFYPEGSDSIPSFAEAMHEHDKEWLELYPYSEFGRRDIAICYPLYALLVNEKTYSLADAMEMSAENFSYCFSIHVFHRREDAQQAQENTADESTRHDIVAELKQLRKLYKAYVAYGDKLLQEQKKLKSAQQNICAISQVYLDSKKQLVETCMKSGVGYVDAEDISEMLSIAEQGKAKTLEDAKRMLQKRWS